MKDLSHTPGMWVLRLSVPTATSASSLTSGTVTADG